MGNGSGWPWCGDEYGCGGASRLDLIAPAGAYDGGDEARRLPLKALFIGGLLKLARDAFPISIEFA